MAFKFVHTADIHLDSPLKSLALRDEGLAELVSNASRTTLTRIIDLCITEDVQALIIAGDLYDGNQTSMKTARFLAREMERLAEAGIPAFVIRGNHDAMSKITKELTLPDTVKVFPAKSETIETTWNGHAVAVHGVSFRHPHAPDSLLPQFGPPLPGAFNIGVLHTSLGGAPGHDPYAPCTLPDLQQTGYEYWALGHIHQRAAYPGDTTIVMPGIPQGRDIGEAGAKSVTLVNVDDTGTVQLEERALAAAQFEYLPVDCSALTDWPDLVGTLKQRLHDTRRGHGGEHLIVRPVLSGSTPLAWRAQRDADILRAEAQTIAEQAGSLWIDKVEIVLTEGDTNRPGGAVGELAQSVASGVLASDHPDVSAVAEQLLKYLPQELRGMFGENEDDTTATLQQEMERGAIEVLARLDEGES